MKKLIPIFILICGCGENKNVSDVSVDSLTVKTEAQIKQSEESAKYLDSVTVVTIEKTTESVDSLNHEIDNYKTEIQKIKSISREKIIYRVDTVYVEKRKNFWGKEKTKINVSSDSTIDINNDTTEIE